MAAARLPELLKLLDLERIALTPLARSSSALSNARYGDPRMPFAHSA